jgi:peptide/nickel transport system permease protein
MLAKARDFLRTAPHVSIFPGLTILSPCSASTCSGDGLRDVLDPQTAA